MSSGEKKNVFDTNAHTRYPFNWNALITYDPVTFEGA